MATANGPASAGEPVHLGHLIAKVTAERRESALREISQGSAPRLMYYVLLGASVVIAAFGLLADSPAVVIGAMLVSPLMTPIFGVCVGLCRADMPLLRSALIAEFSGVVMALSLSFLLGHLPFSFSVTPEIFARTSPNLLDLFVAAFAGLAGCLAMIDTRVSPALPGVAISTSLTPPLAASGLCLAFGAYGGAWGAFLLFFANFLTILAVATVIFIVAGFVRPWELGTVASLTRRFLSPAIGLLVVTVLLTQQLLNVAASRQMERSIHSVLDEQLRDDPSVSVADVRHAPQGAVLQILATVKTAHVLSPRKVHEVEQALTENLKRPVSLFFRCAITKDVGAAGSARLLAHPDIDGRFTDTEVSAEALAVETADQTIREILVDRPNVILEDVRSVRMPDGIVLVASIQTSQRPVPLQVQRVEEVIRGRLGRSDVQLLVRSVESTDTTAKGRVLLGETHFAKLSEDDQRLAASLEAKGREQIEQGGELFVTSIDAAPRNSGWTVRAEVVGSRVPSPAEVKKYESALAGEAGSPVALSLWARTDVVVTSDRYDSVDHLVERRVRRQQERPEEASDTP